MTKNINSRHFYSILAFFLFQVILSLALLGCRSYPLDMVNKATGLTLDNKINICQANGVENFEECKPIGLNWEKTELKMPVHTVNNTAGDAILEDIGNNYLFQNIRDYTQTNNHTYNIWKDTQKPKIHTMTTIEIKQFYEEEAITEAITQVKSRFKTLGATWTPTLELNLTQELKNQFQRNSNSQGILKYIVLSLENTGLPYDACKVKDWTELKSSFVNYKSGKYDLITGIAGFAILNFSSSSKIYEESWVKSALDLVFQNQLSTVNDDLVKFQLSSSIVNSINKKITTEYSSSANKNYFQPMWIQRAQYKQLNSSPCTPPSDTTISVVWENDEIVSPKSDINDVTSYSIERTLSGFSDQSEIINLQISGVVSAVDNPKGNSDAWITFSVYINGKDTKTYDPNPAGLGSNHNINIPITIKKPSDGKIKIKIRAVRADNPIHSSLKIWKGFKISGK